MRILTVLAACATLFVASGCRPSPALPAEVVALMKSAPTFELMALGPADAKPAADQFHGLPVRATHQLPAGKDRDWMVANIERGLVEKQEHLTFRWPQLFGVRAKSNEAAVDLLFDWEKYTLTVFWNGSEQTYATGHTALFLFQKTLFDAGVLPKE